jgi:TonB family protein
MLQGLLIAGAFFQAQPQRPAEPPRRIVEGQVGEADYPAAALEARAEGVTVADLSLDRSGRVLGCTVSQSSGHAALDETTCRILSERFRFERAGRGAPETSARRIRIAWQLPALAPPVPFAPSRVVVQTLAMFGDHRYCSTATEGRPPEAMLTRACLTAFDARRAPRRPRSTRVESLSLVADGRSLPDRPRPPGVLLQEYVVHFWVNASGAVTECKPADEGGISALSAASAHARCAALLNGGRPVFEPAQPGSVRSGRILGYTTLQVRCPRGDNCLSVY